MERESYSDPEIAKVMNANFVSVKVDREERPDVDNIYMTFVQATTGTGGWPMNVWLTPDLKPFVGGTYFPAKDSNGNPGLGMCFYGWRTHGKEAGTKSLPVLPRVGRP